MVTIQAKDTDGYRQSLEAVFETNADHTGWHMTGYAYDGLDNVQLFFDDQVWTGTVTTWPSSPNADDNIYIGSHHDGSRALNGAVIRVMTFNQALSVETGGLYELGKRADNPE